jgi:hypothetical protein
LYHHIHTSQNGSGGHFYQPTSQGLVSMDQVVKKGSLKKHQKLPILMLMKKMFPHVILSNNKNCS